MSDIEYAYPLILNKVASPHYVTPTLRRARLLDWLHGAATCRASVIAADAGYGKTTLLWQWEREVDFPCYWYKLDRNDRDWTLHISYLIEAVSQRHKGFGRRAHSMLQQLGGPGSSRPGVAAYLLAEMHERLTEPCTFIIDDWQYVSAATEVRGLWNQILRDAPHTCRFVFASRAKPKLQFARFKTHGGYAELRTDALRFTENEIDELFRDIYNNPLDPTELAELERRTEGWAASLQLVEVSLRERQTPQARRDFIQSITATSDNDLFEFLAEEVLDQQTEDTRNFLLTTSILQQVTPDLAERLAGVHDGARELLELEHGGLFTYRVDENRYRYHGLFRDFLERRLESERTDTEVTGLHIHAASYFETSHQWPDAIHHYLRAGLQRQAARLIARYGEDLVSEGRLGLIDGWLVQLPEKTVRENARLSLLQGEAAGFRGEWTLALEALHRARQFFHRKGDRRMEALACLKLSSIHHYHGDVDLAADLAAEGIELAPSDAAATRLRLEGNLAVTQGWMQGDFESVGQTCKRIAVEAAASGLDHFAAIALHNLGTTQRYMGRLEEAEANLERAAAYWGGPHANPFGDNAELVMTLLAQDKWARAVEVSELALTRTRPWKRAHAEASFGRAAILVHEGRLEDAISLLSRLNADAEALGSSNELVGAALIDCLYLTGAPREALRAALAKMAAGPSDRRHSASAKVAESLVKHRSPRCTGSCLAGTETAIKEWDERGATLLATAALVRVGAIALDHGGSSGRRLATRALQRVETARLIRHMRFWLRQYAAHAGHIAATSDGARLIANLIDADPEGWRMPGAQALKALQGQARAAVLAALIRQADRGTLAALKSLDGADIEEARRKLTHQQAVRLFIRTFGPMTVHRSSWSGPEIRVDKRRLRMLLGLLAAHAGRALTRDEVLEILWPNSDASAAINSLNQSVFQLRRVLDPNYRDGESPPYLLSSAESIQLHAELVRTDLDEVRRLTRRATTAQAASERRGSLQLIIDFVRGEFLRDLRYEDWAARLQVAVHAEVRNILLPVAERSTGSVESDIAIQAASALTELDEFDERAQVAMAASLAADGRRAAARELLARFAMKVRTQLEEDPSESLLAAYSDLGGRQGQLMPT